MHGLLRESSSHDLHQHKSLSANYAECRRLAHNKGAAVRDGDLELRAALAWGLKAEATRTSPQRALSHLLRGQGAVVQRLDQPRIIAGCSCRAKGVLS